MESHIRGVSFPWFRKRLRYCVVYDRAYITCKELAKMAGVRDKRAVLCHRDKRFFKRLKHNAEEVVCISHLPELLPKLRACWADPEAVKRAVAQLSTPQEAVSEKSVLAYMLTDEFHAKCAEAVRFSADERRRELLEELRSTVRKELEEQMRPVVWNELAQQLRGPVRRELVFQEKNLRN